VPAAEVARVFAGPSRNPRPAGVLALAFFFFSSSLTTAFGGGPAESAGSPRVADPDIDQDGFPDTVEFRGEPDRTTFRQAFVRIAEAQAFRPPRALAGEITDCAALLRFAYREAHRRRDSEWRERVGPEAGSTPALPDRYLFPRTTLGPRLFRVAPGRWDARWLARDFAEFADAETLMRFNSVRVGENPAFALPGDLLFFREPGVARARHRTDPMPFHVMLVVGRSTLRPQDGVVVVYHTGPRPRDAGEIRRMRREDLAAHPNPRWRPIETNPAYLGVHRLNILM
jgi:hypothetical protein